MHAKERLRFLDDLRTFLVFLVVLFHSGMVYESSGLMGSFWIVDDPSTSDLPGLLNLFLDVFVMFTFFFISGFLAPASLERQGAWRFVESKSRRLLIPWVLAVFTLIPLYKAIFLYARGLPQESWTTYFHFTNGIFGMSWLWFLPVLFLFDLVFVLLQRLKPPSVPFGLAAAAALALSLTYSMTASRLGWIGWTKTPLIDFQNERLLPYFLAFLLGAQAYRRKVFETDQRNMWLYVAVCATAWIPMNVYAMTLLNFIFRPGQFLISGRADTLLLWAGFYLSLAALLYCCVTTFKYFLNRQGRLGAAFARLSYGVYVVHVAVLGIVALGLLRVDLPGLLKYPLLVLATYLGSNVLVYAYAKAAGAFSRRISRARSSAAFKSATTFSSPNLS